VKTILNKTNRPIKLTLAGGKVLHLGPAKTGQISDQAADAPSIRRKVKAGEIEISGGDGAAATGIARDEGTPHQATQGHRPDTTSHRRGNR
jgi:hypothetical protein